MAWYDYNTDDQGYSPANNGLGAGNLGWDELANNLGADPIILSRMQLADQANKHLGQTNVKNYLEQLAKQKGTSLPQIINGGGASPGSWDGGGNTYLPATPYGQTQEGFWQNQRHQEDMLAAQLGYNASRDYANRLSSENAARMQSATEAYRANTQAGIAAGQNATQAGIASGRNASEMAQLQQQLQFQRDKLAADQGMFNQKTTAEREMAAAANQARLQEAGIQANAAMYPATLQNSRWNQISPMLQSLLGGGDVNLGGGTGGGSSGGGWWSGATSAGTGTTTGGSGYTPVGTQPKIDAGPIWNPSQIQSQVNAQVAANDAKTAGNNRRISMDLGSRGFGSRSPLSMALTNQGNMANMAANAAADRTIRWDAAQGNASHLLNSQKAQEGQFASRQAEQLENQKNQLGYRGSLINALMGGWK